jgi:hypothetical protein
MKIDTDSLASGMFNIQIIPTISFNNTDKKTISARLYLQGAYVDF